MVGLTLLLLGIVTFAFSQLESPPPSASLDGKSQVTAIRQSLETLDARISDLAKAHVRIRRRPETDRIARNIEQARNGIPADSAPSAKGLLQEVSKLGEELSALEGELDLRQGETARTLSGIEGRLDETKGILDDALDNAAGNLDEVLPILEIVAENLDRVDVELNAFSQLVDSGEKEAELAVSSLGQKTSGILDEISKSRIAAENANSTAAVSENVSPVSKGVAEAVREIDDGRVDERFKPSILSAGVDIDSARRSASDKSLSEANLDQLRTQLEASHNVQVALSEDTEKLQSDLRRAYREIVSLQTSARESERLVNELEESRRALLKTRGQDASGVEAVSRMISRLESELKTSRQDLQLARQSLLSEQERSSTMIRTLASELERTRKELDSARLAASSSGADASRLLVMEQELEAARKALLEAKSARPTGDSNVSDELREELRNALIEVTRLEAELTGKQELESQLAALRQTMKKMDDEPSTGVSAEYVNNLLLELNAAKLAVTEAKADSENLRIQLAKQVDSLGESVGQSHQALDVSRSELDKARAEMVRKEFEFAATIKNLEEELQETQVALQEATQGAIRKVPVVGDMERSLADSQTRIDELSGRFDAEQAKAAELVSALQVELETATRRHQSSLAELAEKDKQLKGQELELKVVREQAASAKNELAEVENIAEQLHQLNEVLDETKKTQYSQVSDADRIIASLREQLNDSQVELVFAKEAKEKAEEQAASQVVALEHQLEQTREQLAATQSTMYDRTTDSKGLIQDLKSELDEARSEIARLKTVGAGDSVGAQQAVAQLQEALGTIRILKESLDQADQVNAEVDGLRAELANAMQSQLADLERSELEKERLRKNLSDLEMEVAMLTEDGAGRNVNYAKSFARLNEQLLASQSEVAKLEGRLAQSENSGVGTIVDLEEQLELSRNRVNELEASLEDISKSKDNTLALLERELLMTKGELDELEAIKHSQSPEVADLERRLLSAKMELDDLAKQREDSSEQSELTEQLKAKLMAAEAKIVALESSNSKVPQINEEQVVSMQKELDELRSQLADYASRQTGEISPEPDLRVTELQSEIESLKAELELTRELVNSNPERNDVASMQKELTALRTQLADYASRQPSEISPEPDLRVTELQSEIESLKAELELSRELVNLNPKRDEEIAKLQSQLTEKFGEVLELETDLGQARERLAQFEQSSPVASVELAELNKRLADSLAQFESAEIAKRAAEDKVSDLTEALKSSQGLRDDLVQLQQDLAEAKSQLAQGSVAQVESLQAKLEETRKALANSEFQVAELKGLGEDLVLLQQDLLTAKAEAGQKVVRDPNPNLLAELDKARRDLRQSEADVLQLNTEFKNSLDDFYKLKNKVASIEAENARLLRATNASPKAMNPTDSVLQTERDALVRENSNFRNKLQERDSLISTLREKIAKASFPGDSFSDGDLRARLLQAEGQVEVFRNSEQSAKRDLERTDAELKEANRRLIVLDEDLRVAQARLSELESFRSGSPVVASVSSGSTDPSPVGVSPSLLKNLSEENERLKKELSLMQSNQGSDDLRRDLQEERQKNLISSMQIDRERAKINDLQQELKASKQVKRETIERERAQQQQIALQDDQLKASRDEVARLEGAVISLRDAIRVLRGGGSSASSIRAISATSPSSGSTRSSPFPSVSSGRGVAGGFASTSRGGGVPSRIDPLPLPSRTSSAFGRPTMSSTTPAVVPSVPVVRSVPTGDGNLEVNANVQFLNNKVRPASDIEFFVLRDNLDTIVEKSGIRVPVKQGIEKASELWARSIQSGYRYPGVAAHIRNALADSSLARIKTDARGLARVNSLAPGTYHIIGTAPLGQVGVVWSKEFTIESGRTNQLNLDLLGASWAQ